MDAFIGEIRIFCGTYAPESWMFCWGQKIGVSQYQALYTILGNTYGGDRTYFNLPDLRGCITVGVGAGPGLSAYTFAQKGGKTSYVLNGLPVHTHILQGIKAGGTVTLAGGNLPANVGLDRPFNYQYSNAMPTGQLANSTVGTAGAAQPQPVSNMQPYLPLNYIICVEGGAYPIHD